MGDDISELGGDVDYIINIQKDNRHSNATTSIIDSPSTTVYSSNKSAGGHSMRSNISSKFSVFSSMTKRRSMRASSHNSDIDSEYEPPNVDVMAMEPVMKLSDGSFNVE